MFRARWLVVVLGVSYAAALAALVFLPFKPEPFWNFLWRRFRIEYTPARDELVDILGNVALFVPLGVLARYGWRAGGASRPGLATVITGAAIGTGIEVVQWLLGWRVASIQDAVCDTVGAAIGSALAGLPRGRPATHSDS